MSKSRKILTGQKFGLLSVLQDAPIPKHVARSAGNKGVRNRYVHCECDCGRKTSVRVDHLRSGKTRSCGCLPRDLQFAQQLDSLIINSPELRVWEAPTNRPELLEKSMALGVAARAAAGGIEYEPLPPRPSQTEQAHGLPLGGYAQMMAAQGGVCAICHEPPSLRPLCVDHDHATGRIRGLLCTPCNHGLGFFKDDIHRLAGAMKYLVGPPGPGSNMLYTL